MKFFEMFQYSICCVLVCAILRANICESRIYSKQMGTRTIKTRYGDLRGALVEFWNQTRKPVEAFRGLQYGTTYAGRMRFMPPTSPLERWKYTRLAFSMRPICPQNIYKEEDLSKDLPKPTVIGLKRASPFNLVQSEDCLSLNIYVPVQDYNFAIATDSSNGGQALKRDRKRSRRVMSSHYWVERICASTSGRTAFSLDCNELLPWFDLVPKTSTYLYADVAVCTFLGRINNDLSKVYGYKRE